MVERTMSINLKPRPEEHRVSQIIAAARQDPRVFGELYSLYAQSVFRYLYSRIGSLADAEDATAQTFLAALEQLPKYRHDGYFASWLFSIAHHKAMDHFRKQRKETSLDEADLFPEDATPYQQVIKTERMDTLSRLIRTLSKDEQELIRLRYVADLNFAEIGHMRNQKEDTVKKSLYRLLARLKAQLEDYHV